MEPRTNRTDRLIVALAVVVLLLGVVITWLVLTYGLGPREPTPEERAREQVAELVGRNAVITHSEPGRRLAVCGYLTLDGRPVAFVSRPNRLMLETDPLPTEFRQNLQDLCPAFLGAQPTVPPR